MLREYRLEDLDDLHALTWQPEIYEFLPDWKVSREKREHWMRDYELPGNKQFLQAVEQGGEIGELRLRLGIIEKATGRFIGWCCTGILDGMPAPNREIAYAISRDHRGKGYTTEAARALVRYLFERTTVEELIAVALVRNVPSNHVIVNCGFLYQHEIERNGEPYCYYRLSKETWTALRQKELEQKGKPA
ncbi:N-acetyltransferase [Paenibacillus sp. J31TS4]|nr:N-acetyltransferase [Paenibacillus sp. J31TS4]